ncbi:hypothetical protein DV735_g1302, partial [Chaetothyriales sp. CBS 134920]
MPGPPSEAGSDDSSESDISVTVSQAPERFVPPPPYTSNPLPTLKTRYMEMLLRLDQAPRSHNIIAISSTWILLVGLILAPTTFTGSRDATTTGRDIANPVFAWISGACCTIGSLGCLVMWFRWRVNYIWLLSRIFHPVFLGAMAGLLSTLANVYAVQRGVWSRSAMVAACVAGGLAGFAGILSLLYDFWALERLRNIHEREFNPNGWEHSLVARRAENVLDTLQRKLRDKPTMPTPPL